jgi:hypothetical protein
MSKKLILGLVLVAIIVFLGVNFGQHLTLENAKAQQAALAEYIDANFVTAALTYFFCLHRDYCVFDSRRCSRYLARCCIVWFLDKSITGFFREHYWRDIGVFEQSIPTSRLGAE